MCAECPGAAGGDAAAEAHRHYRPFIRRGLSLRCTAELAEPSTAPMGTDQDESGYQTQFNAAVSVIQNLPKSGSYKPSYDEMLRFYSYYKQATIGPCNVSRPGFWDPIGRYKWDAWDRLGRMSREDAMRAYINEMKMVAQKILNTFPLENATPEMFEPFRSLYDVIPDMPRPPETFFTGHTEIGNIEYGEKQDGHEVKNQPSIHSRHYAFAPEHRELSAHSGQEEAQRREPLGEAAEPAASDSSLGSWGSANEDCSDSLERLSPDKAYKDESSIIHPHLFQASDVTPKRLKAKAKRHSLEKRKDNDSGSHSAIEVYLENPGGSDVSGGSEITGRSSLLQLSPQVAAMVQTLQLTVQGLCQRLESLERALQDQQQVLRGRAHGTPREKKSWHSAMGRSQTLFFIFVWPFIVHWLLRRFYGRKR